MRADDKREAPPKRGEVEVGMQGLLGTMTSPAKPPRYIIQREAAEKSPAEAGQGAQ